MHVTWPTLTWMFMKKSIHRKQRHYNCAHPSSADAECCRQINIRTSLMHADWYCSGVFRLQLQQKQRCADDDNETSKWKSFTYEWQAPRSKTVFYKSYTDTDTDDLQEFKCFWLAAALSMGNSKNTVTRAVQGFIESISPGWHLYSESRYRCDLDSTGHTLNSWAATLLCTLASMDDDISSPTSSTFMIHNHTVHINKYTTIVSRTSRHLWHTAFNFSSNTLWQT